MTKPKCTIHDRELICPSCVGAKGGKRTARKHAGKQEGWGKQGGRGKKKAAQARVPVLHKPE